jgi:hypothetical protein
MRLVYGVNGLSSVGGAPEIEPVFGAFLNNSLKRLC